MYNDSHSGAFWGIVLMMIAAAVFAMLFTTAGFLLNRHFVPCAVSHE